MKFSKKHKINFKYKKNINRKNNRLVVLINEFIKESFKENRH